jgi:hypothetical protein
VQEDRFEIPEELLGLSHDEIREKIRLEKEKELAQKKKQLAMLENNRASFVS